MSPAVAISESELRPARRASGRALRAAGLLLLLVAPPAGCRDMPPDEGLEDDALPVLVTFETELGDFQVELSPARAPVTTENFLRYVDAGYYDGGRFHRTVRLDNQPDDHVLIEVIQAGADPERAADAFPPIPLERTSYTGLTHDDGTLSMARLGPDTATSDFFICIGAQPSLDYGGARNPDGQGFAAFGRVVDGLEVIRRIHDAPARKQALDPPIGIIRAVRSRTPE